MDIAGLAPRPDRRDDHAVTDPSDRTPDLPSQQHLSPDLALLEMGEVGARRALSLSATQVLILSMLAGGFITIGALFSTLIAAGTENAGVQRLLEGFGFSVGFFLVVLTGTLLFTEVNVELPATFLSRDVSAIRGSIMRLWILAAVGNLIGSFVTGQLVMYAQDYDAEFQALLSEVVASKMRYQGVGGLEGFFKAIVSGMLGNWLVGMAAFLAVMGRTIIGKYVPVFLVVTAFVASGFLHSPANMGFFSLIQPTGAGPGWGDALRWSVLPAAIGNVLGAFLLVALPLWVAGTRRPGRPDPV